VAKRIAGDLRAAGQRALLIAGDHDYGRQLDGHLRLAGLPRAEGADLVVSQASPDNPRSNARPRRRR